MSKGINFLSRKRQSEDIITNCQTEKSTAWKSLGALTYPSVGQHTKTENWSSRRASGLQRNGMRRIKRRNIGTKTKYPSLGAKGEKRIFITMGKFESKPAVLPPSFLDVALWKRAASSTSSPRIFWLPLTFKNFLLQRKESVR
ncbi:hypothetical protein MAR_ORF381 [Marseillevirus marseillevirus]|uniref:Uncharacterized protein n=1 Tax=Marseillevirus marseillevirus TaxID=694581 RepID=D2XB17_GBMV|nr:hypothetical protein MAR_ORF381 [Marseillevirus marseillevirus]ADB04144.1 hypothetical protein MAR_ORF381 [Marseillevirus marseillevirus]